MSDIKKKESMKETIHCPKCHSTKVEKYSLFGQRLMTSKYCCKDCKLYFEAIRWN